MKTLAILLTLIGISTFAHTAVIVFNDTFDYDGNPDPQTNVNDEQLTRQAAGTTTSTYTEQIAGGAGTRDAMLTVANGQDQIRFQTTNHSSSSSQAAVDLDANFASSLVGKHYKITLTDLAVIRGNSDVSDIWFAISVGDTSPSITGPNSTGTDAAVLIRHNGGGPGNGWEDNVSQGVQSSSLSLGYTFETRYAIAELHIDETGTTDIAWAYFMDMNGNEFTTNTWNIDFDNGTNRFIELRMHQGATGTDGTDVSAYIDSMSITVIPEPSAALLGCLGFSFLLRRRRLGH